MIDTSMNSPTHELRDSELDEVRGGATEPLARFDSDELRRIIERLAVMPSAPELTLPRGRPLPFPPFPPLAR